MSDEKKVVKYIPLSKLDFVPHRKTTIEYYLQGHKKPPIEVYYDKTKNIFDLRDGNNRAFVCYLQGFGTINAIVTESEIEKSNPINDIKKRIHDFNHLKLEDKEYFLQSLDEKKKI